ncbi:hypothetical protein Tco_0969537 [Tanacetum coccineum]
MMVQDQEEMGKGSEMPTDPHHTPTIIQPSTSQPQKKQRSRRSKRKDTEVPQPSGPTTNVADKAVNEEIDDSLERVATTTTGLEAEQDIGNIDKTQSKATLNESSSSGTSSGNTLRSGEDRLKLEELMALCTTLLSRVLALETTKTTQATKIASLKKRVNKLERRNKSRTHELKRLYRGRIADIDDNEAIYLVNVRTDEDMFGVNDLNGDETTTTTTTTTITDVEITLAQALAELKSAKPKATTITTTPILTTTTAAATTITAVSIRPKAKGIVIHEQEQAPTPTNYSGLMKNLPSSYKLQKKKKKKGLPEKKLNKLQAQEQDEFTNAEKARLFVQFLEQRRKHFAAKRVEEKRNRPPTRAQQWSIMCTYLKNMEQWKPKSLKNKSFAYIQELFDKAMKRVNTFVDYRTELVEESFKKAETKLVEESSKKQKLEEDKESKELKQCLEIITDDRDDVTINATPLSTKSPTIVDYKIYKEGKKSYFQIIRADVKARFKKTEPVNYMDNFLLLKLKTMFEHHVEDNAWKNQQGLVKVLNWKLYDSCGVYSVTMQSMLFHLLVEKMYPLTNHTLHQMFNDVKLQVDYECEMAFELLRLVKKQLKEGYVPK